MEINEEMFKAYDIRGIYPDDLNEEIINRVGRAVSMLTKAKKIVVGHDVRNSSPALTESLIKGLTDQGVDVDFVGQVSTEAIYFAVGSKGYEAGIIVTASHNPKEYNGVKVIKKGPEILSGQD